MYGGLDGLDLSAQVEVIDSVSEIRNRGMGRVISAKNLNSLLDFVWRVNILH
jgi:hypothetical protein